MPDLFSQELEDKFNGAVSDKENSPFKENIFQSLSDTVIQDEWVSLKKAKSVIKDEHSYAQYLENLKQFFNSICEKITAPGVDAFIEWLNSFGKLNENNCELFRHFLINNYQYSDYASKVESILSNASVIQYDEDNPKLFDNLLKAVTKTVKTNIDSLLNKPELFDTTTIPFLDSEDKEFEALSNISELGYTSSSELFSKNQIDKNIVYYQDVIEDSIRYINDVKAKNYLGKENADSDGILFRINDLRKFIENLNLFGIASNENVILKSIFDKIKNLIVDKNGTLVQQWTEFENKTWIQLESFHDTIAKLFLEKNDININALLAGKVKWLLGSLVTDLTHIVDKFIDLTKTNPLETIEKISAKDLKDELAKKSKYIDELNLNCANLKANLFGLIDEKIDEYDLHKIPIIESISLSKPGSAHIVDEIKGKVAALKLINTEDYLEKDFLVFLSNDFEGFYEIYESLDFIYTELLSNSGLKDDIEWLNEKLKDNEKLDLSELDLTDSDKIVALMKVNLIKLTLTKNV